MSGSVTCQLNGDPHVTAGTYNLRNTVLLAWWAAASVPRQGGFASGVDEWAATISSHPFTGPQVSCSHVITLVMTKVLLQLDGKYVLTIALGLTGPVSNCDGACYSVVSLSLLSGSDKASRGRSLDSLSTLAIYLIIRLLLFQGWQLGAGRSHGCGCFPVIQGQGQLPRLFVNDLLCSRYPALYSTCTALNRTLCTDEAFVLLFWSV